MITVLLVLLLSLAAAAQTISGDIHDPAGAAIPAAKIKIVNQQTGAAQATISNDTGSFRSTTLTPGDYRVEVEADGFQKLLRGPLTVEVGQVLPLDLVLQVGAKSDTVNVTEAAPLVDSQTSSQGQIVNREMLSGLPLPNRAASSLATLAPGVVMIDTGAGTAENYPVFSVAGGRARNQSFTLDGGNVSNAVGLTRPQQLTSLPVDAMQEFKVIANNYSAEFGHSTGGVVTMSTRSGTNQFHGSLFESLRNDVFDARNFFAATKPPIRLNQFGGAIGGPIRKDKTHFFATWEQTRQTTSDTFVSTVPTLANRAGDFSDLRDGQGNPILIYDPATTSQRNRLPFQNNRIPPERIDPVARAVLDYIPLPNRQGTATNATNYVGNSS